MISIDVDEQLLTEYDPKNSDNIISDFSYSIDTQIKALEESKEQDSIVNRLISMYELSHTDNLSKLLTSICHSETLSMINKLQCAISLTVEDYGYDLLNMLCQNFGEINVAIKIDSILTLMNVEKYKLQSLGYFISITSNKDLGCDFRYKTILILESKKDSYYLENVLLQFVRDKENYTYHRVLAGQYLLRLLENPKEVEEILLSFARDVELDYDRRADAADVLITLGSEDAKQKAREIIEFLGDVYGNAKTIYENAQNVHSKDIEESILEIIEKLPQTKPGISYSYVTQKILDMLIDMKYKSNIPCKNCGTSSEEYCSKKCREQSSRFDKINNAIDRIYMDRSLYTKDNIKLMDVISKIWSFLEGHNEEETMRYRLLEELEETSNTCASGYISRIINVVSGIDGFNVRISWSDQIVANMSGRINALARKIEDPNSTFHNVDIVELWLKHQQEIIAKIVAELTGLDLVNHKRTRKCIVGMRCEYCKAEMPTMKKIVEKYLEKDRDEKISFCVSEFADNVYSEMAILKGSRENYLYFFRTILPGIIEELHSEFKEYISEDDFSIYIRKAIMVYDYEEIN